MQRLEITGYKPQAEQSTGDGSVVEERGSS
jgi:hypothetical protein